ncbi:MAG TPA: FAD-dependent oxidoreductase [Anaerolineaceae bacterium]|nr:FAD-dependent oxidoreductase [Longilinea sp.]HNY99945.1 FAD-dependent oxidoreductase [Anaerolineaceae bacterium]HOD45411.1 FAD-dependent oxidoreductase [Anaerolineaceae bacterium]HOH18875.1 FAD-dependent oxidoreductase [Anaerolineaceae bacterium]HPA32508.1 FAD-dependent oxidoreductase [Anaerolineaceae bacterium]
MTDFRIRKHPILPIPQRKSITFYWQGTALEAQEGETISAALFANGIRTFGHHPHDGAPQGIFCANGQCAQCMVIADGRPVKSCMELVKPDMQVMPLNGLPVLPDVNEPIEMKPIPQLDVPVLIIGGGPAGLSAAIELGKLGIHAVLLDDKHRLGGKLVLQTHRFFGSTNAVFAGTRGIDIATRLEKEVRKYPSIDVWTQSTALAVFSDQRVGVLKNGEDYILVKPQTLLVACGAREKFLTFKGNTLPGVYGAGAFQTLVNRDLVRPAEKLFIVGGGNVGLIAAYHALQAGIGVVGLVEALPECGGYKVHKDKIVRMGVPIYTSHTVLSANGTDRVESVTIAKVDSNFKPIPGTERSFECDSLLIAVGLDPVNEFYLKAKEFGMTALVAGDAEEIAEASAAIFSGKIKGLETARSLGYEIGEIPASWYRTGEILKSKPGKVTSEQLPEVRTGVVPVIHCVQEIPCDPCSALCPHGLIDINNRDIRSIPQFIGNSYCCEVCERCVAGCPGLAITLVDYRSNPEKPLVSIPYEFTRETIKATDVVTVLDTEGEPLGDLEVYSIHSIPSSDRTLVVQVEAPIDIANRIAGIRIQETTITQPMDEYVDHVTDDVIVCRCERVTAGQIRSLIRQGYRDINEIKTVTRAGMGACGGKTCTSIIHRLFREEGIPVDEIVESTKRPIFVEVPLSAFAGEDRKES